MYEYREAIHQLKQGQSVRGVSLNTPFGRNTVKTIKAIAKAKGWLDADDLPTDETLEAIWGKNPAKRVSTSQAKVHEKNILAWAESGVSATLIHQQLCQLHAYTGSYSSVQRFIKEALVKPPELTAPLDFEPGEAAQVDFGQGPNLFDERQGKEVKTWFFVMTLCWSRHQFATFIAHQDVETWLYCHQQAFEWFGGLPNKVIIDNPKCAITKACYHDPNVQRSYEVLAQAYGFIISACPPREPKKKGRVESGVKYIKRNFLPLRELRSLQDANQQLKTWILEVAGQRNHGTVFEKPLDRFERIERQLLITLPVNRPEIAVWYRVRMYKDCHIRYLKCLYSVPHTCYGKPLWAKITATLVTIYCEHTCVATHARCFKAGERKTLTAHLPPKVKGYLLRDKAWCLKESETIGSQCHKVIKTWVDDPVRDLLRQAQSLLKLAQDYPRQRLEKACERAVRFHSPHYKTIKAILKQGLDYEAIQEHEAWHSLSKIYQGEGYYQRQLEDTPPSIH